MCLNFLKVKYGVLETDISECGVEGVEEMATADESIVDKDAP